MKKLIIGLLALLIMAPAVQAAEIVMGPQLAWAGNLTRHEDGTVEGLAWYGEVHVATIGTDLVRAHMTNNFPGVARSDYYPFGFKWFKAGSLTVELLDVTLTNNGGLVPGVRAVVVNQIDQGWGGGFWVDDWDMPIYYDLGLIVPANTTTAGDYTIDMTQAFQEAYDRNLHKYLYVELRLEGDMGVAMLPPDGVIDYRFNQSGSGLHFDAIVTDVPEPSTIAIGLSSLMTLWLLRRKK